MDKTDDPARPRKRRGSGRSRRPLAARIFSGEGAPPMLFASRSVPRRLYEAGLRAAAAPVPVTLCLIAFFLVFSTDFLILLHPGDTLASLVFSGDGAGFSDARRDDVEAVKADLGIFLYAAVALLTVVHRERLAGFVRENLHFVAILGVILLGMFWSIEPSKVLTNTVQLSIGLLIAALFALTRRNGRSPYLSLYTTILMPLLALHLMSVWIFFDMQLQFAPFLDGVRRYGGVAGNPNALGGQCVIGTYVALALLIDRQAGRGQRALGILGLLTFAFNVAVSGSGTALVAALLVVAITLPLRFLSRVKERLRIPSVLGLLFVAIVGGGAYAIENTSRDLVDQLAGSLGKESNFTGRTELWETARAAIAVHPIRGWSLDSHASVTDEREFDIRYNHYHNGFLDLLVAGGLVLGLLVAWNTWSFVRSYLQLFPRDPRCYAMVVPLFILIVLNLTEYSLLRPLNVIYQLYLCAWAVQQVELRRHAGVARPAPLASRRRSGKGSGKRAFSF